MSEYALRFVRVSATSGVPIGELVSHEVEHLEGALGTVNVGDGHIHCERFPVLIGVSWERAEGEIRGRCDRDHVERS